jgi:hypothetical protein
MEAQRVGSDNFSADSDNQRAGRGFRSQGEAGPTLVVAVCGDPRDVERSGGRRRHGAPFGSSPPLRLQHNERRVRVRRISDPIERKVEIMKVPKPKLEYHSR